MKPLMLKGHERAITELTYNHDGDLLFTSSKDNKPCLWWAETGERIGTYRGHNGTVWSLSVSRNSKRLLTGSADNSAKIWDVQSGRELFHINSNTPIRAVKYGYGDHLFFTISDSVMGFEPKINIHRHAEDIRQQEDKPLSTIAIEGRVQTAVWGMLNQDIAYASSENVIMHDVETNLEPSPPPPPTKHNKMPAKSASQRQAAMKKADQSFAQNIHKRGQVTALKAKEEQPPVGPVVLGLILFVVVGSALLQVIRGY